MMLLFKQLDHAVQTKKQIHGNYQILIQAYVGGQAFEKKKSFYFSEV
jgi:hypothetical protein